MGESNLDKHKRKVYEVIIDCWAVAKKYGFAQMTEDDWQKFIDEAESLSKKWKAEGSVLWMLYRRIIGGLTEAITAIQRGDENGN